MNEKAIRHNGRYGAVILPSQLNPPTEPRRCATNSCGWGERRGKGTAHVTTPKRDIFILGFRLDQMYTNEKARDEERNGMATKCETACIY